MARGDELPAIAIAVGDRDHRGSRTGRDVHAFSVRRGLPVTLGSPPAYCFQLQMPPDLHGQAWMRVSMACAFISGLRCASLVRAAPRGFSARKCATLGCATLTLSTATFFGCGFSAAEAGAASTASADLASPGTRPNRAG